MWYAVATTARYSTRREGLLPGLLGRGSGLDAGHGADGRVAARLAEDYGDTPVIFIQALVTVFMLFHHEVVDEPSGPLRIQSPTAVHRQYVACRATTTYCASTFWQADGVAPYRGDFNHLWCDDYPFWQFDTSHAGLSEWADVTRRCVALARAYGLPKPLMVAQAFGKLDGGNHTLWRCPTRWEHWRLVQIARQLGAGGILWWRPTLSRYWCGS